MSVADDQLEARFQTALARSQRLSAALEGPGIMGRLARLPVAVRESILGALPLIDKARLCYHFEAWARPKQNPPISGVDHRILFWCCGRGFGKTFAGGSRVKRRVERGARSIAIVGPTLGDIQKYMLEGTDEAPGLLRLFHPSLRPVYKAQKGLVFFKLPPGVGGKPPIAYVNTAEKPEFRGPNLDTLWGDEFPQWRYLTTMWANIELATRARGVLPIEIILTSTPLGIRFLKQLVADEECITLFGATKENAANVDPRWLARMQRKLGGTRLGMQELEAAILGDNPDAMFASSVIDACRVESEPPLRVIISVDPAITEEGHSDETGILVMGDAPDGHMYVIADLSGKHAPEKWGKLVIDAYDKHQAVAVVCETNRGGNLVVANVRAAMERKRGGIAAASVKIEKVHASKGKMIRAEPVGALHERGFIHMVGVHKDVEGELTEWNPRMKGPSPNRLDALVWGAYWLGNLADDSEPAPDYAAGFKGLSEALGAAEQPTRRDAGPGLEALLGQLGQGGWGSTI